MGLTSQGSRGPKPLRDADTLTTPRTCETGHCPLFYYHIGWKPLAARSQTASQKGFQNIPWAD